MWGADRAEGLQYGHSRLPIGTKISLLYLVNTDNHKDTDQPPCQPPCLIRGCSMEGNKPLK